ncbi:MAG TPA: N-methyl-D-aspartate receptor NMDAR2C subunit [Burkholderiaceae bacterium]|nr:N-methyl-D-aspartate receptor NMDAR2C subunit [Burkholderiaceae bacterium]
MNTLRLPQATRARLRARHAQSQRRYHTQAHVDALLHWLALHAALAARRDLVEAAIWFHDAVYDPTRADNEAQSAALARTELAALAWPDDAIARVAALVLATQHHDAARDDRDAWLFLDLDLSILGQSATTYRAYAEQIRAEYAFVPEPRYREGRIGVLGRFLERDAIYRTPALHAAWETTARANLADEIRRLRRA